MKILVTGGAGFIGSNLVDALIEKDHDVMVIDNLSTGKKENINPKAQFEQIDITDKDKLESAIESFQPEAIHHLAAQASVRISTEDPQKDILVNVIGTVNLLELALKHKVKKFIFSSTGGAIYGDGVSRPTVEGSPEEPVCPYGIDKLFAEKYIKYFSDLSELQTICLRYANVYGPRQDPKGEAGVVAIFSLRMIKDEACSINGTGEQTRDFVFVSDVVGANLAALASDRQGTYNIGTAVETNINDLAEMMKKVSGSSSKIEHAPAKQGEQMNSSLAIEKAKSQLNWKPEINIEEGLQKTINYFKDGS